jgi:hypothetical protein
MRFQSEFPEQSVYRRFANTQPSGQTPHAPMGFILRLFSTNYFYQFVLFLLRYWPFAGFPGLVP